MQRIIIIILLFSGFHAHAETIYKCKNKNGIAVFSQTACSDTAQEIEVSNPKNGIGDSSNNKTAQEQLRDLRRLNKQLPRKTAQHKKSNCPSYQSITRRKMVIKRKLFKCMTKPEVSKVFRRSPDNRRHDSDGEESWHYHLGSASAHLFFDSNGLLKSWSGWN